MPAWAGLQEKSEIGGLKSEVRGLKSEAWMELAAMEFWPEVL